MARIFRQRWTQTVDGKKITRLTAKWYIEYRPAGATKTVRVPGFRDKKLTQQLAAKLEREADEARAGIIHPPKPTGLTPIGELLAQFRDELERRERSPDHVKLLYSRISKLTSSVVLVSDISAEFVETRLHALKAERNASAQTRNHYLRAVRQFTRWLVRKKALASDPLADLQQANVKTDRRHVRRSESADALGWLISSVRAAAKTRSKLSAEDRVWLYLVAAGTGFRAKELASVTPLSFALDGASPTLTVLAADSKRKCDDVQPIPADMVAGLKTFLTGRPATAQVWPGKWASQKRAGVILKLDLADARQRWIDQNDDATARQERAASDFLAYRDRRGRVFDFHALRVTYITALGRAGIAPGLVQTLARHSDPRLTFGIYTDHGIDDRTRAVDQIRLPIFSPASQENEKPRP